MDINTQNDKEVEKLEKKLRAVYLQAQMDTQAKMEDYLRRFATKDAIKREQVQQGKITQAEYTQWRIGQIAVGKQWRDKVDALAADYTNANRIAMGMVRKDMAGTFATNHNYAAYQLEHDTMLDLSFTLYDENTLANLVKNNPDMLPLPSVDIPKDQRWNKQKINSVITQAVLQGDSIPKIAQSLQRVTDMNHTAAVRNARTSMTAAQNAGRVESYKHAQDMGIEMEQEWLATLDSRTRHSHRKMDGERIPVAKDKWHPAKFSNGCRYPGDPQAPASEIYNCRCTLVAAVKDVNQSDAPRNSKLGGMSYEEWKAGHKATPVQTTAKTDTQVTSITTRGHVDMTIKENYTKTKYQHVMDDIGVDEARAKEIAQSIKLYTTDSTAEENMVTYQWTGKSVGGAEDNVNNINEYIQKAPKWDGGRVYRGERLSKSDFDKLQIGDTVGLNRITSWSSDEKVADRFAKFNVQSDQVSVKYVIDSEKGTPVSGVSITHLSGKPGEKELLFGMKSKLEITRIETGGSKRRPIYTVYLKDITY